MLFYKANMLLLCYMMLLILEPPIFFFVSLDCVIYDCDRCYTSNFCHLTLFFFFPNQQVITWHTKVYHGSYFITMYRRTKLHERRRNDKEEEKIKQGANQKGDPRPKERNKLLVTPSSTRSNWWNIVRKSESFRIRSQKHDEVIKSISSGVPVPIVIHAFIENMLLVLIGYCLHGHLNSSLGKNRRQYSPIGVWLVMALVALAHSELE